jgi:methylenetetrahydrofolate reductase (NADPH)
VTAKDGFTYAIELVEMLRSRGDFSIGVAAFPEGHPESKSLDDDAKVLAAKQKAGADFAITNLFFSAERYFDMIERATSFGCDMPILPGLMPVTNVSQIQRFAALTGAQFPSELADRFDAVKDDADAVKELGIQIATELSEQLLAGGAPGIHLYTLNHSTATRRVFENLGVTPTS